MLASGCVTIAATGTTTRCVGLDGVADDSQREAADCHVGVHASDPVDALVHQVERGDLGTVLVTPPRFKDQVRTQTDPVQAEDRTLVILVPHASEHRINGSLIGTQVDGLVLVKQAVPLDLLIVPPGSLAEVPDQVAWQRLRQAGPFRICGRVVPGECVPTRRGVPAGGP